jgi:hypothetical protein
VRLSIEGEHQIGKARHHIRRVEPSCGGARHDLEMVGKFVAEEADCSPDEGDRAGAVALRKARQFACQGSERCGLNEPASAGVREGVA